MTVRAETLQSVPTVWSQTHNAISSTSSSFPVVKTPGSWSRCTTNRLRGSAHNRSSSPYGVSSPKPPCSHLTVTESFPYASNRIINMNACLQ